MVRRYYLVGLAVVVGQAVGLVHHQPLRGAGRRATRLEAAEGPGMAPSRNVLGGELESCCGDVGGSGIGTGFYRDGYCSTGNQDAGRHTVCVVASAEFLEFSKAVGNDLSTPIAAFAFPGVRPGDRWCLCASRWEQARQMGAQLGAVPKVLLRATHEKTLQHTTLEHLKEYAQDLDQATDDLERLDALRQQAMRAAGLSTS